MNVDIWSDIACPWCFIGKRRFESALSQFEHRDEIAVTWHSYQLDPTLPEHYDGTEVQYLSERKGMPQQQVQAMFGHVAQQAAGEGLHYDFDHLVVANSLRGHQLLHLAQAHGVAGEVKEALLSAHFEHGEDIGDVQVLERIGVAAGLDAQEVRDALADGRYAADVRADIEQAATIGIQGVPFFVVDQKYAVSGAQPPSVFRKALDTAWAQAHPLTMVGEAEGGAPVCGPDGCAI